MKKKRKELTRAAAMFLAALLTVNSVDLSVLTSYAAQSEYAQETTERTENKDGKETAGQKKGVTITGFDELEESITNQQLAIGAGEEEIVFPYILDVTVSVSSSDETADTGMEETEESEISETEKAEAEESETSETEEAETEESETSETEEAANEESESGEETGETEAEEDETTESESAETETVTTEQDSESGEDTEDTKNSETEEINENDTESDEQNQSIETASLFNTFFSAFAPLTVYAAETEEDTATQSNTKSTETTENVETKEITLTEITWKLNVEESDKDTFDSSEECDGYCYVYTPVIPEKDAEGNKIVLGEDVETPMIYVMIGESEEHISLTGEVVCGDFTVSGEDLLDTDYSYADGVLTIKTNKAVTIKNTNPDVATTAHIVVESEDGANITLAGVNIDVSSESGTAAVLLKKGNTNITLESGTVNELESGENYAGLCVKTSVIIDGDGVLNVFGGKKGAGIGGANNGSGETITIKGGTVTATGGYYGAGIGGGRSSSRGTITISGGTVMATGGYGGAGIGGGWCGNGGTVVITGGNIQATGGSGAEDIGHGENASNSGTLKDGNENNLSLHTITLCGLTDEAVSSINGVNYSVKDVKTLHRHLYLYLPASAEVTSVEAGTKRYTASLTETTADTGMYHPYTYTTEKGENAATIKEYCNDCEEKFTITVAAPDNTVYTGEAIEATVTENPLKDISCEVEYKALDNGELTNGKPVNSGKYRASITWGGQNASVDYEITKKVPEVTDFTFTAPSDLTYNAEEKAATITAKYSGMGDITVSYYKVEDGSLTLFEGIPENAGTYQVHVKVSDDTNYGVVPDMTSDDWRFTIQKATPTVTWSAAGEMVYYTGNAIWPEKIMALTVKGVDDANITDNYGIDDVIYSYRESGSTGDFTEGLPRERGEYEIKATVSEKENYTRAETATADYLTLKIDWLDTYKEAILTDQNGKTLTGNDWWAQRVTFIAPTDYTISNRVDGTYAESFIFDNNGTDTDSDGVTVTYYLKNSDGEIAQKSQTVYIDHTAPTFPKNGGIVIGKNNWESFLNTITFGILFKENVDVKVVAEDSLSGIKAYYYWVDKSGRTEVLTADELAGKQFTESIDYKIDTIAQDSKYVYYVYVMDKAGNKSEMICSNGVVVDMTPPEIEIITEDQSDTTANITVTATDTGSGVDTYYLVYSTGTLAGVTAESIKNNTSLPRGVYLSSNQNGSFELKELSPATTYYYAVTVSDRAGNLSAVETGNFTTAKTKPVFEPSDIPKITGTYGETLSEMKLSATKVTSSNRIEGTWSITHRHAGDIYPAVNGTAEYEITFTPDDTAHFDIYVAEVKPQVAKKELTVSAVTAKDRKYDGTDKVKITGVTLDGIREYDNVSVDVTEIYGTVDGSDVGTYTKVTALSTLSLTGNDAGNYELIQPEGEVTIAGDVKIEKALLESMTINKSYYYGNDYPESIDLTGYLPKDYGTISYKTPFVSGDVDLNDSAVIDEGKLIYSVKKLSSFKAEKTGTIEVTIEMQNYESITITVNLAQIDKLPVIRRPGTSVTLKNNVLTYGQSLSELEFNSAMFVSEENLLQQITGTLAWSNPDTKPSVGTSSAEWTFTPAEEEYAPVTGEANIIVNQATPKVETAPTVDMTYNPNTTLSGIDLNTAGTNNTTGITVTAGSVTDVDGNELPGTWSWNTSSQVPQGNNNGYKATFTPTDTANYETVTRTITVTVAKATPYIDGVPTAAKITYGQTLADSNVQGNVYYDSTKNTPVAGYFGWENENTKPTAKTDSDTTKYTVIFKPIDSVSYNEVSTEITITVDKAQYAPNMPGSTMSVAFSCKTVGAAGLPEGWIWSTYQDGDETTDQTTALEVGVPVKAATVYEGADEGNYINESVVITITRSACDHVAGEILYTGTGEHAPDCENTGLGHRECTKCHEVMESGIVVPELGHQGGTATCTKKAVCTVCQQEYGTTNPDNHAATEVRGHKNADCTSAGYTGDTHCADCGTKLKSGTAIAALGHKYKSVETTAPTTTSTGVRTYTCERCGYSYTETIPKLPEEAHNHSYTATVTRQADCTNAGTKTYTCSCGDSYTESIPALGHHYVSRMTKEATATEEGIMTYTCDRCGHSYTRPIAKLESNKPDNNKPGNDNKPGDNNKPDDNSKPDTNRPETGKPYIEGREDKNGWENIKDQLETAKDKNTVTVEMNGTTVVPGDIFAIIKGKDVSVVFDMGDGIYWKVNGKDITEEKIGDIDFGVTVGSQAGNTIPVEIINKVTGERYSMNLTLSYDGEFGFTATLTLNVDKENAGLFANLFYYNPASGELEYICADRIDEEGNAELTFTHASDYTIVIDEGEMQESTDTGDSQTNADQTAWNPWWIIVIGAIVVIVGLGIFFVTKKKKEETE